MKLEKFTNFREFTRPREGRIYRALTQRMYLLKAEQIEDDEWTFSVLGVTIRLCRVVEWLILWK